MGDIAEGPWKVEIFADNGGWNVLCNVVGMFFSMGLQCVLQCVFAMRLQKETTICLWTGFFFPGKWVGDLPQEVLAKFGNRAERTISIN